MKIEEKLTLDFAKIGFPVKKLRDVFFISKKDHKMRTRNSEKFKINHTNTKRYFKSPIPTKAI